MSQFRPTLAVEAEMDKLQLPVLGSPKLDGIRCLITADGAVSRNLKPIKNHALRERLERLPIGLDGELILGKISGPGVFKRTTSAVMSHEGDTSDVRFHVFDTFLPYGVDGRTFTYAARLDYLRKLFRDETLLPKQYNELLQLVEQIPIDTIEALWELERRYVAAGFEGLMLRAPTAPYKFNRSTMKEGYLLKVKRFYDAEAQLTDVVEELHNTNEAKKNALGVTERSTAKAGKIGKGTLGALACVWVVPAIDPVTKAPHALSGQRVAFELGSGFTAADRATLWSMWQRGLWPAEAWSVAKFKYQEITADGAPRFPVWLGFRDKADLDPATTPVCFATGI